MRLPLALALLLAAAAAADEVWLKNGSMIEGDVTERGAKVEVTVSGGTMTIDRASVDHIVRKESRADEYARRAAEVADKDVEGHRALAQWCDGKGLPTEARRELEAVLRLRPDDPDARRALGFVKIMGRWVAISQEWTEVATEHFSIRTDTGRAEEIAAILEAGTRAFLDAYGRDFVKRGVEEPYSALIFRNRDQFVAKLKECYPDSPQAAAGFAEVVNGFSLPVDRVMLLHMPEDAPTDGVETLLHEMTHLLFYDLAVPDDVTRGLTEQEIQERLVDGRGLKWWHEGFASYFGGSTVQRTSIHVGDFPSGGVASRLAKLAAKAIDEGKAIPLGTLVEGGVAEFTGPDCLLYYAESWSLVHFLHEGLEGKMRPAVGRIGQLVAQGEGGREGLERALKVSIEDLAPAWRLYVKELAQR